MLNRDGSASAGPSRTFRLRGARIAAAVALALACGAKRTAVDDSLAKVMRDYRALPDQRALAIAGDLRRDNWVAGSSGGHATRAAAEAAALRACRMQRHRQRMQAACGLYAVGDEIVGSGR